MRNKSKNPIVHYLKYHLWEWVPASEICKAVGCTPEEIRTLAESTQYRPFFNIDGDMYRYLGASTSPQTRIVKVLKSKYPEWLSSAQITKITNLKIEAWYYIKGLEHVLPIETECNYVKYHLNAKMYRYVPDDKRSLIDFVPLIAKRDRESEAMKNIILDILMKYKGEWFSSRDIADRLGGCTPNMVTSLMRSIVSKHWSIQTRSKHPCGRPLLYSYRPEESSA